MGNARLKLISREFTGFDTSFTEQAARFREHYAGWDIDKEFVPLETLEKRMVADRGGLTDKYDLFLCCTDWLPQVIHDRGLLPLNRYLQDDPPEGWPEAWSESLLGLQTDTNGNIYGLPYHDGPEMLIYRHDLFEDARECRAFQQQYGYPLKPPSTWRQFLDTAAFFTRPEQGMYGAVAAGFPDGHNNVYDFFIHLWSRGGEVVDEHWQPVFDDAIGEEALQYYTDLYNKWRVFPPEAKHMDSVASGDYYASGKAAMMWNWCGYAGVAEVPALSKVVGKTSTSVIPRGDGPKGNHISLNIYWVLGIPSGSRQPDTAYRFIKHCASAAMDKVTSLAGGNGTRLSTWRDPDMLRQFPYYRHIEEIHRNVRSPLAIPEYPAIDEVFNRMVDDCVNERQTVRHALAKAADKVRRILGNAGHR
jgi:multiple sugar transport system substrate-binding protein